MEITAEKTQEPSWGPWAGWKVLMLMAHEFFSLLLRSDFVFLVVARGFPRLSPSLWASLPQTVNGNILAKDKCVMLDI